MNKQKYIPLILPPKEHWELSDYLRKYFGSQEIIDLKHPNWDLLWEELKQDGVKLKFVSVDEIDREHSENEKNKSLLTTD